MKSFFYKKLLLISIFALLVSSISFANSPKRVRVRLNGKKQYFVLFQSPAEPTLYYCGQIKPQVLIRELGKEKIPEISLIRYQKKDIKDPEKLVQGAHFRMHLDLGPSDKALEMLKKKIPSSHRKTAKLSPVPFKAIKLCFQKPDGQEIELKPESLSGISNHHSAQMVAFSSNINVLNTDLLDSLLKGNTGAKYILYYNYKYSDPILTGEAVPESLQQRDLPGTDPRTSKPDRKLPGSRDFDKINRKAEEKAGWKKAGQGFIGFADYPKSVQDKCVFIETDSQQWNNAYLSLPVIQMPSKIDIEKIELDVKLIHSKKAYESQKLTWTPKKFWRDRYGAPLVYGVFDLTKVRKDHSKSVDKSVFRINQRIESNKGDILIQQREYPIIAGDSPVSDPLSLADILEFQTGFLTWAKPNKNGLKSIEVKLTQGDWTSKRSIAPEKKRGKFVIPELNQWLIKKSSTESLEPLIGEVFFVIKTSAGDKKIPWTLNGKDLRKNLFALSAIFFDQDWKS